MFWIGFGEVAFSSLVIALVGAALVGYLGKHPWARVFGYAAFVLAALNLLSTPFALAARYEGTETLADDGPGCAVHTYEVAGESLTGFDRFSLATSTHWCWDGEKIAGQPVVELDLTTGLFWRFDGVLSDSYSGGASEARHRDYHQVSFSYCLPLVGCLQHLYPTIRKEQFGNGQAAVVERRSRLPTGR